MWRLTRAHSGHARTELVHPICGKVHHVSRPKDCTQRAHPLRQREPLVIKAGAAICNLADGAPSVRPLRARGAWPWGLRQVHVVEVVGIDEMDNLDACVFHIGAFV